MAPLRRIYLEELARLRERVNEVFERALLPSAFDEPEGSSPPGTWSPPVDMVETADAYMIYAELPGVARDEVELQIHGRRLELSGRRRPAGPERGFLRMERSYGPFRRSFELDRPVDADAISARFERGILTISVPKLQPSTTVPLEDEVTP